MKGEVLIMVGGLARVGAGFTNFLLMLNPRIRAYEGPPMNLYFPENECISLKCLQELWADSPSPPPFQPFDDQEMFRDLYDRRVADTRVKEIVSVAHDMISRYYKNILSHVEARHLMLYCARDLIPCFRSYKRFFGPHIDADYFLTHLETSVLGMREVFELGSAEVTVLNVCDSDFEEYVLKFRQFMKEEVGINTSIIQDIFLAKRRKIGASEIGMYSDHKYSDEELLKELEMHPKFDALASEYMRFTGTTIL